MGTLGGWAGGVADQLFGLTQSGLQEDRSNKKIFFKIFIKPIRKVLGRLSASVKSSFLMIMHQRGPLYIGRSSAEARRASLGF